MRRREFLVASAALSSAVSFGQEKIVSKKKSEAVLRLSCQEWIVKGKSFSEKVGKLAKWGFEGIELRGKGISERAKEYKQALKGTGIKVSAISAGYEGALGHHDLDVRNKAVDSIREILGECGELKSTGLIFVPAFNGDMSQLSAWEVRKALLQTLPELAETAKEAGTRLLLKPLNRKETIFVRLLADAAAIVRDVNSSGIGMMGDFCHMGIEETSDLGAVISGGSYLHHMHLATTKSRILPGQEERSFIEGFRGLKIIGFHDFCSLSGAVHGDSDVEIPKSAGFLRKQWELAKV